ncbi:MAG TPA: pirin family protein [Flavipsychrobacter sp.]|nr:pirin family protein [Flavipsychrobacter sp.]
MQKVIHVANSRGHANHGWLDTYHTFSFAGYQDPARIHFGVLRVLNDDIVKGGYGFGKHPHDNMEIITIVLDGALEHKDTMGHTQAIHPDEVQVMSAGTGLQHSEYNHNRDKDVNLLQIWIFPDKQDVTPRYDQKVFPAGERINKLQALVSPIDNQDEGLKIHQHAWIYRSNIEEGKSISHHLHSNDNGLYVFVIDGDVSIDGQTLSRRDGMGISGTDDVKINATKTSDVLLLEIPMKLEE